MKKCRAVIVGHSHYDHACDAPFFAKKTGATFLGSSSSLHLTNAAKLDLIQTKNTDQMTSPFILGDQKISFIKSLHGPALFGKIPYPGEIDKDLFPPIAASKYRAGGTSIVEINSRETTIWHIGSAGYLSKTLKNKKCDILLLTVVGIQNIDDYIESLVLKTNAKVVIPIHFDNMFTALGNKTTLMPFFKIKKVIAKLEMTGRKVIIPKALAPLKF